MTWNHYLVAPLVGAWIEILGIIAETLYQLVAPLVGAWIEIFFTFPYFADKSRRTPRGSVD